MIIWYFCTRLWGELIRKVKQMCHSLLRSRQFPRLRATASAVSAEGTPNALHGSTGEGRANHRQRERRSMASVQHSRCPKAVRRMNPSPDGPKPTPGVVTT